MNCSFSAGSRALGCVLVLNQTGTIQIERVDGRASYEQQSPEPLGEFTYSVFDWEEDGSVGTVPVLVVVSIIPRNLTLSDDEDTTDVTSGSTGPADISTGSKFLIN